jgi:hypothetical protein
MKHWTLVAFIAAALTALIPLLADNAAVAIVGIPLSFGVILGSLPFGGLHNGPPVVAVFALACVINAIVWGGAFRLTRWGRRRIGQSKESALDHR